MSAIHELLAECHANGIELLVEGDDSLIIDAPHDALTSDLLDRLKGHKAELLAMLGPKLDESVLPKKDEPSSHAETSVPFGADGWPVDCIDASGIDPCPLCGTLELWQTRLGTWRCLQCAPPTQARRFAEEAERIRRRPKKASDT